MLVVIAVRFRACRWKDCRFIAESNGSSVGTQTFGDQKFRVLLSTSGISPLLFVPGFKQHRAITCCKAATKDCDDADLTVLFGKKRRHLAGKRFSGNHTGYFFLAKPRRGRT